MQMGLDDYYRIIENPPIKDLDDYMAALKYRSESLEILSRQEEGELRFQMKLVALGLDKANALMKSSELYSNWTQEKGSHEQT